MRVKRSEQFDLTVAYRIYPGISKKPFVIAESKLEIAEIGVRTFKDSISGLSVKIYFLLDNCPSSYEDMIKKYFDEKCFEIIKYNGIGNLATFKKQIEILLNQNHSDYVYFAEDDYVYRPNLFAEAFNFIKNREDAHFITPFDHRDSYSLPIHTKNQYRLELSSHLHWRTSASTTLTFLTTKKILSETKNVFLTYCKGNWDSSLWFSLTKYNIYSIYVITYLFTNSFLFKTVVLSWIKTFKQVLLGKKYYLWQPIPSIATHMEKSDVAPNINWYDVIPDNS